MKLLKTITLCVMLILTINVFGQHGIKRTNNYFSYKDRANEFGGTVNLSYFRYEGNFSPNFQLDYDHFITKFFSIGVGYGITFNNYIYNTFTFDTSLRLFNDFTFTFKPGFSLKTVKGVTHAQYSMGACAKYEFKISDNIYLGPKFEIAILQDDVNYLAGIHLGYMF